MFPPSRLASFCEKFIQVGWLIALIAAPLYFNIYSSRVFEPDKIVLIRTLALAMGAVWLILRAERWRATNSARRKQEPLGIRLRAWVSQTTRENPLTLPALGLWLAYIVSTLLSLSPTVSFFGSYQRLQGFYTFSSYLVIFFLAASQIKTRADVERVISIVLVGSFPTALYGILQHYFLDPLPWIGDVTSRVASNLGNSIFIGAFLILTIPLALARLIQSSQLAADSFAPRARIVLAIVAFATISAVAGAWALAFDLGAKPFIESSYTGTLTPQQLLLASGAFNLALAFSFLVVLLWWGAAFLLRQRAANFLLVGLYAVLLAVQLSALLFSQSRGPLLGFVGGMFTFGVLYALVRGARRLVLGLVGLIVILMVPVALANIPNSPLAGLRELPYVGRMGRIFELEGGTGRVRVLIWQGALQLVLPHAPLWSPLSGDDPFNPVRPLVGYGPETMYVAYNKFYPPELGTLESRNATPDRSHNETFDALVNTGLLGFVAENIVFLMLFYYALKWLGLMPGKRALSLFVALWFGGGATLALAFGLTLGWEFIGVALPGGMILGMFVYLIWIALREKQISALQSPASTIWLVALVALFVSHFIEIHFGIAIVTTRLYFWFFAAVLVAIGARGILSSPETTILTPAESTAPVPAAPQTENVAPRVSRKRSRTVPESPTRGARNPAPVRVASAPTVNGTTARARKTVSTASLIVSAFLVGYVLAVMGYDYITTNNIGALGGTAVSGLDIVTSALTIKQTTTGGMFSPAMLLLFVTTLLLGIGISAGEWGRGLRLYLRDWGIALFLFIVLAFAIFSGLVFYHVILIATTGATILDALLTAVILFTVFTLLVITICAITLLFDESLPTTLVNRATNWVVAPVLALIALVLIFSTNIEPIRADMLYKQAAGLTGSDNAKAIALYERALALQPQQDYYDLFLGRAYLDAAKAETDIARQGDDLNRAEQALQRARQINPYNTDHSANLARLAQARGALAHDPAVAIDSYKQASVYFDQATRLSPNTAHLYDQHAQALLEYAQILKENNKPDVEAILDLARAQIQRALQVDPTFCLTHAVRSQAQTSWRARVSDALKAIEYAPRCGDVFFSEGLSLAVNQLAIAGDEAVAAHEGDAFETMLTAETKTNPTLELYTTLANFYSKAGRVPEAIAAVDSALTKIGPTDADTRKRYEDFRFTLVELQKALDAAKQSPGDPELARAVAQQWLARGQIDLALPAFQHVVELKPDDYAAQRNVILLQIANDQLDLARPQIAHLQAISPDSDKPFWQGLATILNGIGTGDTTQAVAQLQELAKSASTQDFALVSALRKLADKLKGTG